MSGAGTGAARETNQVNEARGAAQVAPRGKGVGGWRRAGYQSAREQPDSRGTRQLREAEAHDQRLAVKALFGTLRRDRARPQHTRKIVGTYFLQCGDDQQLHPVPVLLRTDVHVFEAVPAVLSVVSLTTSDERRERVQVRLGLKQMIRTALLRRRWTTLSEVEMRMWTGRVG